MKTCFLILFVPLFSIAQNASQPQLIINGNFKGLPEKSEVFLLNLNKTTDTVAKGFVQSGKFVLTGHVAEPNFYEINFPAVTKKMPLFIGNDLVSISGDVNDLTNLKVTGSASQNDFTAFQQTFNPLIIKLNSVVGILQASQQGSKYDSLMKEQSDAVAQIQSAEDQFLQKNKSSYISPFMLLALMKLSDDVLLLDKRYTSLAPQVQNSFYGNILRQQIASNKIGAIGTDEIDFTQNDTQSKPVSLSSFKGKYVLVDFWASWCHPCRLENPNVVAVYNKFKTKNFTILSVSLDKSRDPWLQAIKEDNLTWTHVSDLKFWNNDVAVKYHVQQIPQNFLVDPTGKIVAKNLRGADLESKLCQFLGCN